MGTQITTSEAAARLGLTVRAIQKMIEAGRLSAQKIGRDYLIDSAALESIPKQAAGRPPKLQANKSAAKNSPPINSPDGKVKVKKSNGGKKQAKKASKK